jgi:hypothetical protein
MDDYQREQFEAHGMVLEYLEQNAGRHRRQLEAEIAEYLDYRGEVDRFLGRHFSGVCSAKCFRSRLSACCSREGVITFFADVVVNALAAPRPAVESLLEVLRQGDEGFKCVYLAPEGCRWRVRPIVCSLFLCEHAQRQVFDANPELRRQWCRLEERARRFKWPDRPVLFDLLETRFLQAGYTSSLMYLHQSPGLLRVKRRAGLL